MCMDEYKKNSSQSKLSRRLAEEGFPCIYSVDEVCLECSEGSTADTYFMIIKGDKINGKSCVTSSEC